MSRLRFVLLAGLLGAPAMAVVALPVTAYASPITVPQAPATSVYVVQKGDYLSGIADKLKVRLSALLAANKLTATSLIYPGMKLNIPVGGVLPQTAGAAPPPAASAQTTPLLTYEVKSGDSLSGIAATFKVKLRDLLDVNKLTIASVVHPGGILTLPAYAAVSAPQVSKPVNAPTGSQADPTAATSSARDSKIATLLAFALAQQGKPYRYFSAGPDAYDCSGLVKAAFATIGISMPHQSLAQSTYGTSVDWNVEPIRPGDLVFMYSSLNLAEISHVGIAITSTTWIQAPRGGDVVRVGPLPAAGRIVAVRRLVEP